MAFILITAFFVRKFQFIKKFLKWIRYFHSSVPSTLTVTCLIVAEKMIFQKD